MENKYFSKCNLWKQWFFYLKDGNSVTDQSGNSNNGTASGNLTKSEDNPSNVFATFNALMLPGSMQYQNGNTSIRPQANSVDFQGLLL